MINFVKNFRIKRFFKNNNYVLNLVTRLLHSYLSFVYFTSRWKFVWPDNYDKSKFLAERGVIFAFWHNRLAIAPGIFKGHNNIYALISPHSDGKVISSIVNKFNFGVIEGSTNKNSVTSLKLIIKKLLSYSNIVITPDGPRGPIYKINSNITAIAKKYNIKLIPLSCESSKKIILKSWDQLIIPLPFSTISVFMDNPIVFSEDETQNNYYLEKNLIELTDKANKLVKNKANCNDNS